MSRLIAALCFLSCALLTEAATPLPLGNMDQWLVRRIHESRLLGGKVKTVYALAPTDTVEANAPFVPSEGNPWCSSNVYAAPLGIAKGSNSVTPEPRGSGYCARMDALLEQVKVAGMVNISVAVAGSIYLGRLYEPVKSAGEPYKNIDFGIPFTKRPKALVFDYRCRVSPEQTMTQATGTSVKTISGHDTPHAYICLQRRWEDERGNIYASRIAASYHSFTETTAEWVNGFTMPLHYGGNDLPDNMPAIGTPFCARNSRGKIVPIKEVGWADPTEQPTHLVVMFCVSSQQAFVCRLGNALWVDNVKLDY